MPKKTHRLPEVNGNGWDGRIANIFRPSAAPRRIPCRKGRLVGFPPGVIWICIFLSACAPADASRDSGFIENSSLPPAPTASPSPFQPETPAFTPSPSATVSPSATPTESPSAYLTPIGGETLRFLADSAGFGIGTPYLNPEARDPLFPPVLTTEFNTVMMTTFMKKVQPERDRFDWSLADSAFQLAQGNGMEIVGGPLVYDNLTAPAWLGFDTEDCGGWRADTLEGILKNYVQTTVSRFGKQVAIWEVVNEPLTSGENCWRAILGDEYIDRAFLYAHEADPDAVLMLNEAFSRAGVDRDLTDRFMALVRRLKDSGIPLDAIGIQLHLSADILRPTYPEEFRSFLHLARRHGAKVMITEMDVYQGPPGFFADPFDVQQEVFGTITRICLNDPRCTHLMVWGVSDRNTWLSRIEGGGFENPQPLLFDDEYLRKPAYYAVLDALRAALAAGRR
jgi:endo-1,4-beta-xylanase